MVYDKFFSIYTEGKFRSWERSSCGYCRPILQDMLNTAQNAVEGKGATANLRFAHGENTIPLAAMLGIKMRL